MISSLHRYLLPLRAAGMFALVLLSACAATPSQGASHAAPLGDARQIVLVLTEDWNATTGSLQRFESRDGHWRAVGASSPVAVGRNGTAWGAGLNPPQTQGPQKAEGDGRAPAGVFALTEAFGYAASDTTRMPYRAMQASHYCIDVPDSPYYNRIVDTRELGEAAAKGSTEPMRLDLHSKGDPRYRKGLVIGHNIAAVPRAGSCIFAHLWRTPGEPTAGCTAMAAETMDELLAWLQPQDRPLLVLLPRTEYARLSAEWALPRVENVR